MLVFGKPKIENLDFENDSTFIIESVFQQGDVEDVRMCRRYYGEQKLASVLLKTETLNIRQINLVACIVNHEPAEFASYERAILED